MSLLKTFSVEYFVLDSETEKDLGAFYQMPLCENVEAENKQEAINLLKNYLLREHKIKREKINVVGVFEYGRVKQ